MGSPTVRKDKSGNEEAKKPTFLCHHFMLYASIIHPPKKSEHLFIYIYRSTISTNVFFTFPRGHPPARRAGALSST
jgi:hypothetical protein